MRAPSLTTLRPWLLATLAGVMTFLGFAGFGVWPLALIAFVPLFFALDEARVVSEKRAFWMSLYFGFVANWGGYYWLVGMLAMFSGFPFVVCVIFASVLIAYTAGSFAIFGWLWARGRNRGLNATWIATAALCACEWLYPMLFPFYYGASFHDVPMLMQVAELGGPFLVTAIATMFSGAVYELFRARIDGQPIPKLGPISALIYMIFVCAWGTYALRRPVEDPISLRVGMVQANMGLREKRFNVREGDRRHREQSMQLETQEHPDLIVWPESSFVHFLRSEHNIQDEVMWDLRTPLLFGSLQARVVSSAPSGSQGFQDADVRYYNTAFLANANGDLLGSYDKTYLLAFGEYLPFGETFPILYEWSPNSGHFTPGNHVRALPFPFQGQTLRLGTMICYEDILPSFVRKLVAESHPQIFVNITNDAWFGDTHEPWIHFALAKFRAIEHRIPLVRSTNSGVSGFFDDKGRVISNTRTFVRDNLVATIQAPRNPPTTIYARLGDWPGYLAALFFIGDRIWRLITLKRRRNSSVPSSSLN